ncbi:DUF1822 family protein [Mastigocoleus testarum]|uniref:DUF1822 family protein n=1 Tax=Mastigocoleus testarum BC008 TaxID=371196 RepID=A0A0V7ZRH3_9CYAN|nr:DUF1822 family protein [Mastigocoleus testarum]KST66382.1 hypothetical protein BC008_25770 [Mastigocoleus testarum BC008]KST66703.1 hypothetical protein BC008_26295 [Mastigocoleus testarum BC008]
MSNISTHNSVDFRLLIPEVIYLESEHFDRAEKICLQSNHEDKQWQNHLNSLAVVAFKDWFKEKLSTYSLSLEIKATEDGYYLSVGKFNYFLITVEHLLDEIVNVSKSIINTSTIKVDFYVLIEVLEEEEEVIIKGFLNNGELHDYCTEIISHSSNKNYYQIPLSIFDSEPNHLLLCHQFAEVLELSRIEVSAAELSTVKTEIKTKEKKIFISEIDKKIPKLSEWFKNIFDEGWLTIDKLTKVETNLAFNTIRKSIQGVRRGKLIDLEIQLGKNTVALLVNIVEVNGNKFSILVQLHPTGKNKHLPHNLQLRMFSKGGKVLQDVQARIKDNYIQLKPFKGEAGKRFSIEVALGDVSVKENFEI